VNDREWMGPIRAAGFNQAPGEGALKGVTYPLSGARPFFTVKIGRPPLCGRGGGWKGRSQDETGNMP
jgi:hypothetical protein